MSSMSESEAGVARVECQAAGSVPPPSGLGGGSVDASTPGVVGGVAVRAGRASWWQVRADPGGRRQLRWLLALALGSAVLAAVAAYLAADAGSHKSCHPPDFGRSTAWILFVGVAVVFVATSFSACVTGAIMAHRRQPGSPWRRIWVATFVTSAVIVPVVLAVLIAGLLALGEWIGLLNCEH